MAKIEVNEQNYLAHLIAKKEEKNEHNGQKKQ